MKKSFFLVPAIACCLLASCGLGTGGNVTAQNNVPTTPQTTTSNGAGVLGGLLSGVTGNNGGSSVIGNIISTFASGLLTNQATLVGTWNYSKPCVQFESENLLAKAGGSVVANKVEGQLESLYKMAGIKPGACTFVFNSDNTCLYTINGKTMRATYTFDSQRKTITITTALGLKVTAYVSVAIGQLGLTFDASKLLTLVTAASGKISALNTLTSLASNFNGMKIGFEFSK